MWRDIPGWEGRYQAHTDGRIRSKDMEVRAGRNGNGVAIRKGRELTPVKKQGRYLAVTLAIGERRAQFLVHDLIMLTFHGPKPEGYHTRHLNDDKYDNRFSNMVYGTVQENNADRCRNGRTAKGERHGGAKLGEADVREIRKATGTLKEIAKRFNISTSNVCAIRTGRTWKHV